MSRCALCKSEAVDSVEIECGNNAENSVALWLCDDHFKEYDDDSYFFQNKYNDKIEGEWLENLLSYADSLQE